MKTFKQFRENFANGRNPQDRGDSARHGIPKKATIAQLEKIRSSDSASPRKKQLAHWQINMRRGREKTNEQRVDKHEVSGKVVIDGHVFNDAGKSGRSTYGRYSVKDPNYVKDTKEAGMHRNYRKPSTINFDTLAKAKSWVKTQPKKSKEEIDRVHKKHADFEKELNESTQFAVQGHQVHADSNGMKIYHGGELVHHIKGDFSNPTKMDRARVQRYVTNKIQSSSEYKAKRDSLLKKEDYENPYRFDWGTPEGTAYMKKMTPNMKFEPMFKNNKVSLPATKKIIRP